MKYLSLPLASVVLAAALGAQAKPAPVQAPMTTIFKVNPADGEFDGGLSGSPGGKLIYYKTTTGVIRVYNRSTKTSSIALKGTYQDISTSAAGDWLVMTRLAEDAKPGTTQPRYVWTVPVNPKTGIASGEPRKVSTLPANAPAFSPDGKWIAFIATGNPRRMLVIPASGGPERVLFERGGPNGPLAWSPDGRWLYFQQPSPDKSKPGAVISKVSVDGGTPVAVTPPGLAGMPTLDGKHILTLAQEDTTGVTFDIFDGSEKLVGSTSAFHSADAITCDMTWSGEGMKALAGQCSPGKVSLHVHAIAGGTDREVLMGGLWSRAPSISPDGKQLAAAVMVNPEEMALAVMNADGSGRRPVQFPLGGRDMDPAMWSPDGKYLAFTGDNRHSVYIADVATAKATKVGTAELHLTDIRWRADSRAIRYTREEGTETKMQVSVHEATLGGQDRLVLDLTSYLPPQGENWYGTTWFLGDSSYLVIRSGLLIPVNGGPARKLYEPVRNANGATVPTVSADGQWVGIPAADGRSLDIVWRDGRPHHVISLPGSAKLGQMAYVQYDSRLLITAVKTPAGTTVIYALPVDGSAPRTIETIPTDQTINDLTLSPDGKTVLTGRSGATSVTIVEADLGLGLKPPAPVKKPE